MTDGSPPHTVTRLLDPDILPPFAARCTILMAPDATCEPSELPDALREAVAGRQREFLAGRYCARRALERVRPDRPADLIGRGLAGEPIWPAGVTGSIAHVGQFASAAVALTTDAPSLGIDSERLERFDRTSIERLVLLPQEATVGGPALANTRRLPLVFSAKEAIFKCLYPLVGRRFYFESATLVAVSVVDGTFAAALTRVLGPGVGPDLPLHGRFVIDDEYVHTGVWLPARA